MRRRRNYTKRELKRIEKDRLISIANDKRYEIEKRKNRHKKEVFLSEYIALCKKHKCFVFNLYAYYVYIHKKNELWRDMYSTFEDLRKNIKSKIID